MPVKRKHSPLDYAFSIGKIRALERFLIKPEVFEEAIESDFNEALRLFAESDLYSADILYIKDSQKLETVLNQELINLKKLVSGLLLDKELLFFIDTDNLGSASEACRKFGSEFLNDYITHLIDMHNIKTFLRLYILEEPEEKLRRALTCEGFIKNKDFLKLYTQDLTALLNRLEYVHKGCRTIDYTYYIGEAVQKTVKEKSFAYLEKAINDFLIQILKPAKYITFGPEPVIVYYLAKVNEINLIRMIILAKLNNIENTLVKERLNDVYV